MSHPKHTVPGNGAGQSEFNGAPPWLSAALGVLGTNMLHTQKEKKIWGIRFGHISLFNDSSEVWCRKEFKKLQMSNPSPETQNWSIFCPQLWLRPTEGGSPGRAVFRSAFPWCLRSCHTVPYEWEQCHVHAHLSTCPPYLWLTDTLILFSFTALTAWFLHLCWRSVTTSLWLPSH